MAIVAERQPKQYSVGGNFMRRSLSLAVLFLFFAFAALPSFAQQACQNALQDVRPTSFHFDPSGGNGTIVVVLSVNGCNWGASSQNDWTTLHAPTGGTQSGNLNFTVQPNGGSAASMFLAFELPSFSR